SYPFPVAASPWTGIRTRAANRADRCAMGGLSTATARTRQRRRRTRNVRAGGRSTGERGTKHEVRIRADSRTRWRRQGPGAVRRRVADVGQDAGTGRTGPAGRIDVARHLGQMVTRWWERGRAVLPNRAGNRGGGDAVKKLPMAADSGIRNARKVRDRIYEA